MDEKQLQAQLDALKSSLETALTAKAKKETEDQIKALEEKLSATKDIPALRSELNDTKSKLADTETKLAKVISEQDKMIAEKGRMGIDDKSKSFNTLLSEAIVEKTDELKSFNKNSRVEMQLKAVGDMSFAANFSTADVSISTLRPGIIELPKRKLHIRELLPGGTMSNSTFTFIREKTTGEGNPATVAEGNWKEQMDIDLEEVDSPTQYIAGYLVISRKMLDDIPAFISFLQSRLLEKYLRAEDVQLLYGDGNSPNLSGITTAGNHFVPNTLGATIDMEQIIYAISALEMKDREANGVLVSPQDYYRMALYKASGSGEYTVPALAQVQMQNGQLYIGGVPVFRSTAMITDKAIVGDWTMGAQLITREAPKVEIFYEDGYNVRRNQVTVRIEGRVAFPIYGDDYFAYLDLGNS